MFKPNNDPMRQRAHRAAAAVYELTCALDAKDVGAARAAVEKLTAAADELDRATRATVAQSGVNGVAGARVGVVDCAAVLRARNATNN